ncbi:class A beta-lactamase-related serine hydrolase [Hymenobacter sp. BT635]|uniref:Class A beta-lactamase-related serine hydrolase n=1 Tax=Hymenobacter nitidus TaxID=2880929 RepID=A0ABS8AHJ8_9BACT|nr:serine hydrolase [Hymenobacter nitidus]MCB2378934.1 class A beta-lactamase-related serine hydrolase [Hymenobacter nitidus]
MRTTVVLLSLALLLSSAAALLSYPQLPQGSQASPDSPLLDSLLRSDAQLLPIIRRAQEYEVQIIYTQINRDKQNRPHFTQHTFHLNPRQYFNPASLVKLPVAILALEKLNQLNRPGLNRNTPLSIGTAFRCQTAVPYSTSPDSNHIHTVGNYIKRMLLVSDNAAYNRLYEFLGQRPLNERLCALGYPSVRITRRFAPCDTAANRHTNPFAFYNTQGEPIYQQPAAVNQLPLQHPLGRVTKGRAYQARGKIVREPYDFTTANYLPLQDITAMLKEVMFPQEASAGSQLNLLPADYKFLRRYLRQTPHGSGVSLYKSNQFHDAYKKYLYYGRNPDAPVQKGLHIYNVVGMSHGYLADVAYIIDFEQRTEFMLSAVIYVNKDGILNDGNYEYTTIGLPFLAQLGRKIHQYEASRPKLPEFNPKALPVE